MLAQVILYTLAFLYALNIPVTIAAIGKPRGPVAHRVAIATVLVGLSCIVGLVYVAGQL